MLSAVVEVKDGKVLSVKLVKGKVIDGFRPVKSGLLNELWTQISVTAF